MCGISAQTAICHIRLSRQPPQKTHPFHGLIETVTPSHRNGTVSRNHCSLLRDKHLQMRTSSKHSVPHFSRKLQLNQPYVLRMQEA